MPDFRVAARTAEIVATTAFCAALLLGPVCAHATNLELYARTLAQFTREVEETVGTRVDYRGLRQSADWPKVVASLAATDLAQLRSEAQKKAFWINAYNILAIDRVVREEPTHSIKDLGTWWNTVWRQRAGTIDGRGTSLHVIEHEILRPMNDPRVHGALVCASTSCPSLLREPWAAERLDEQFDSSLRRWLSDTDKGLSIDRASNTVRLSRVFKWFSEDFADAGGSLRFAAEYRPEPDASWLREHADSADVEYLDYDWSLNRY